jgi:hypothetical protein
VKKKRKKKTERTDKYARSLDANGHKGKKNKRQRKREKKIDAHFGARFIHSFILFSSSSSFLVRRKRTHPNQLDAACLPTSLRSCILYDNNNNKNNNNNNRKIIRKKENRKKRSKQSACVLGINIFIIPVDQFVSLKRFV